MDRDELLRTMDAVSRGFLLFHLMLLFLFFMCGARTMILVSLAASVLILVSFFFARREMLRFHTLTIYTAQIVEMLFAAYCIGFSAGLQVPLLGMTLYVFFCEFIGRAIKCEYLPGKWVVGVSALVFFLLLNTGFYAVGRAPIEKNMITAFQLMWNVPIFVLSVVEVYFMIHQFTDSERALTDQAHTDKLTGLINRAGYEQIIRHGDLNTTTMIVFDADKFKHINDTYGHEVGDLVLKKVARTLKANFRLSDYVCRTGGDEFVVLMISSDTLEQDLIVRKIGRINRELSHADDKLPVISVSAGVAYGENEKDWKSLFNHADETMYQVKQAGGRGCRFYSP